MTIQYHSDTSILFMGNTNVCCPIPSHFMGRFPWESHGNDIPMDNTGYSVINILF